MSQLDNRASYAPFSFRSSIPYILLALAASGLVYYATALGVGMNPDSAVYISVARNFAAGRGLLALEPGGAMLPLIHYPPLYPIAVGSLTLVVGDALAAAKWYGCLLFAANSLLVSGLIFRITGRSAAAAAIGAVVFMTAPNMLIIHSMAWSEAQLIFFMLLTFQFLSRYLDRPSYRLLVCVSFVASCSWLTRYAGVAVWFTTLVCLMFLPGRGWRRRITDAILFGVLGGLGNFAWSMRNLKMAGTLTNHPAHYNGLRGEQLLDGLNEVTTWALPKAFDSDSRAIAVAFALVVLIVWTVLTIRRGPGSGPDQPDRPRVPSIVRPLCLFLFFYEALLIVTFMFFDRQSSMNYRLMSPVFVVALLLGAIWIHRLFASSTDRRVISGFLVFLCVLFAASYVARGGKWIARTHACGLEYSARRWGTSEVIQTLRQIPEDVTLYSNGPDVIYLLTERQAKLLPGKWNFFTGEKSPTYEAELAAIERAARRGPIAIVVFQDHSGSARHPSGEEVAQAISGLNLERLGNDIILRSLD